MNTNLNKVLVIDPVVDVEESYQASEVVYKSGVNKSIYKYTADSNSDSNWIWNNITPPSLTTVVKRDLRVQYTILVLNAWTTTGNQPIAFNAVNSAGAPAVEGTNTYFGCVPRAAPIGAAASAIELRLNGSSTSTSNNDYTCVYPHIIPNEDMARWSSEMPLQKDSSTSYLTPVGNEQNAYNRSPFASYGANPVIPTRASYVWQYLGTGTSGTQSYNYYQIQITEQLMISPMLYGELMDKSAGLSNINNLILNIRFADLNRMISAILTTSNSLYVTCQNSLSVQLAGGQVTVTQTQYQAPTLLIEYVTQDPVLSASQPQTLAYDYSLIQPFISACGNWTNTTADSVNFTAQSLRLASIPSKLYIFARPSKSALNTAALAQGTPDTFLRIKELKINFNNRVNLFATYSESDLFNMSVKNGLQDMFSEWKFNTGSVCIVDISRDIGLEPDEDVGQANKYSTLQVSATLSASPLAYNVTSNTLAYDFYILVEQPGKCFISSSECQYILTGPSSAEVLALTSNLDNKVASVDLEGRSVGGSIFGHVGKLFKSGLSALKNVNPEHIAKGVEMAQKGLSALGMGVAGGAMRGKHSRVY